MAKRENWRGRPVVLLLAIVLLLPLSLPAGAHGCSHSDHYALHGDHYDYWDYNGHSGTTPNHFNHWYNGSHAYASDSNCNEPY